jgi:hypothetical protein
VDDGKWKSQPVKLCKFTPQKKLQERRAIAPIPTKDVGWEESGFIPIITVG